MLAVERSQLLEHACSWNSIFRRMCRTMETSCKTKRTRLWAFQFLLRYFDIGGDAKVQDRVEGTVKWFIPYCRSLPTNTSMPRWSVGLLLPNHRCISPQVGARP